MPFWYIYTVFECISLCSFLLIKIIFYWLLQILFAPCVCSCVCECVYLVYWCHHFTCSLETFFPFTLPHFNTLVNIFLIYIQKHIRQCYSFCLHGQTNEKTQGEKENLFTCVFAYYVFSWFLKISSFIISFLF